MTKYNHQASICTNLLIDNLHNVRAKMKNKHADKGKKFRRNINGPCTEKGKLHYILLCLSVCLFVYLFHVGSETGKVTSTYYIWIEAELSGKGFYNVFCVLRLKVISEKLLFESQNLAILTDAPLILII